MANPNKRKQDESQALSQMRKELEKKQEAMKTSERAKNQLKKKVEELSKKHHQLKEEFQATFQGLNAEKERLTIKVIEQAKIMEELRKYEHMKARKIQKYVKYFTENDESKSIEAKEMAEENNRRKKLLEEKNRMIRADLINQTTEDRKGLDNWRKRYQETVKENYSFWALLERYIEQYAKNKQITSTLFQETKLLADKDLEIWNQKKELQEQETMLAKVIVDLSITRAKHQIAMQKSQYDEGSCYPSSCYAKVNNRVLENEMKALQNESSSMKNQIHRLESDVLNSMKIAKSMRAKLRDAAFKSKDFDDTLFEIPGETKELALLHGDFTKVTCRLENRINMLDNPVLEKGKKNSIKKVGNARKIGVRFLDRILKKTRRDSTAGI